MVSVQPGDDVNVMDADGTLHVRGLTIPPSRFWSPEFKHDYVRLAPLTSATGFAAPPAIGAAREDWARFDRINEQLLAEPLTACRKRYDVRVEEARIGGVRVGIVTPAAGVLPENEGRVLINLHGGGFVYFSGLTFGQLESIPVAAIGGIRVVTVDYRQAPTYRYPAATQDVEVVYREILKQYKPGGIGIYGCSAGGVLTSQSVAWFHEYGLPRPGAVGIFGAAPPVPPWPYGKAGDSIIWASGVVPDSKPSDAMTTVMEAISWYMGSADCHDAKAYPGSDEIVLKNFPPALFLVGSREAWLSSAIATHCRLLKLGVDSFLYLMEGGWHEAHVLAVGTPEAYDANAYIARWFGDKLTR